MITRVQDVYYNVQDMGRAAKFYRDVLGFKVIETSQWWTTLELAGFRVGLHGTGGPSVPHVARDAHGAHAGATLTLQSSDIELDTRSLQASRVKILGTSDGPWGKLVVFEDTEGNVLKLMQPLSKG